MKAAAPSAYVPSPSSSDESPDDLLVKAESFATPTVYRFRLYVADDSPNSSTARANLAALCKKYLPEHHEIEVVDVFREPVRTRDDHVTLTPMLIKLAPLPMCRIVGTLHDTQTLLGALSLKCAPHEA